MGEHSKVVPLETAPESPPPHGEKPHVPADNGSSGAHTPRHAPACAPGERAEGSTASDDIEGNHKSGRTWRKHIIITLEDPEDSVLAKGISIFMMVVILLSTVCFILESEVCDGLADKCGPPGTGFLPWDPWAFILYYAEWVSVLIFMTDYVVRFSTVGGPRQMWRFFISIMNLIDLIAWLPFWIIGASTSPPFALPTRAASGGVGGVGFVRAIRLVRVFRVFKAGKLRLGIKLFAGALMASVEPMTILSLVLSVSVIIFSSIIWLMERPDSSLISDHLCLTTGMCDETRVGGMQSLCFGTIPSCFWWCLTTMTTVGYGDCYPITIPGKMLSVVVMMSGIMLLALPITVLGSNFEKMVAMYEDDAKEVSSSAMADDGQVTEFELREYLVAKKREGVLRKDVDIFVPTLMRQYDVNKKGSLSLEEFGQLEAKITIKRLADPAAEMQELKVLVQNTANAVQNTANAVGELAARFERIEGKLGLVPEPL